MIKAENDFYYMTAGEACYIMRHESGSLSRMFFGKRVEAEDDLTALGMGANGACETPSVTAYVNGKKRRAQFMPLGAEVLPEKPTDGASLVGGKTLKIELFDQALKLKLTLLYTPYSRGGIVKTVVIENAGEPIALDFELDIHICAERGIITVENGIAARTEAFDKPSNFAAVVADGATEAHGDVCGFLNVYGDADISVESDGGKTGLYCARSGVELGSGQAYRLPDMLFVYSDSGVGGMSRVFHDILRDNLIGLSHAKRVPVVLFAPVPETEFEASVRAAGELGCDVFAVDGGEITEKELAELSEACKAAGVKLGMRVSERIKKQSVLFGDYCKNRNGKADVADIADRNVLSEFVSTLSALIGEFDIEYIMMTGRRDEKSLRAAREICGSLTERFGELFMELGNADSSDRLPQTLYYPPCAMRNVVDVNATGALKVRFDWATFGRLGYSFDPLAIEGDVKRAVRAQILSYQDDAALIMNGDLYRVRSSDGGACMIAVGKDKARAYAVCAGSAKPACVKIRGLDEHNIYRVRELDKSFSGAALCACGVPIPQSGEKTTFTLHIRQVADYE